MKQESKRPLYKVLNEQRTQKDWIVDGYTIGTGIDPMDETVADFKPSLEYPCVWERNMKEMEANAQYTAIAVNNLHHLAEALEMVIEDLEIMKGGGLFIAGSIVDINMTAAKEALSRIS